MKWGWLLRQGPTIHETTCRNNEFSVCQITTTTIIILIHSFKQKECILLDQVETKQHTRDKWEENQSYTQSWD